MSDAREGARPMSMRKQFVPVLKLAVTIAVLAFIVYRLGWQQILLTLSRVRHLWLGGAVLLFVASGVLGALQWRLLLSSKSVHLSFARALKVYFMGMFFNNFIFGTAAADSLRIAYVKIGQAGGKAGFAATFLDRFAGFMALLGFAIFGSAVLLRQGLVADRRLATALLALAVTFCLFVGVSVFLISRRAQRLLLWLLDRVPVPKREWIVSLVQQTMVGVEHRMMVFGVAVLATVIQLLRIGVHILCGGALGVLTTQNFQYFFIFVPILAIFMLLPMPFGVREGVEGALFALAGFRPEAAVVMGFLATLVSVVGSVPGGVFFVLTRARKAENEHRP